MQFLIVSAKIAKKRSITAVLSQRNRKTPIAVQPRGFVLQ